ncbi:MAG: YggU family protein [Acidobacteria bacterium]|nr:YggU family protein [Acidobacteriota bacterium]
MTDAALQIRETRHGLVIRLHVQPRARRSEISGIYNGALKIKVTAPPVDDAANRAVVEYLASLLGVSKSKISIRSGTRSKDKVLLIKNISLEELHKKLGIHS